MRYHLYANILLKNKKKKITFDDFVIKMETYFKDNEKINEWYINHVHKQEHFRNLYDQYNNI